MDHGDGSAEMTLFPCVCCGYITVDEPGSYDICPVCNWEDDISQLRYPTIGGGANPNSLVDAQLHFAATGSSHPRWAGRGRVPAPDEFRDNGWRPLDPALDNFETEPGGVWPTDYTTLYWWRSTYWRRRSSPPDQNA